MPADQLQQHARFCRIVRQLSLAKTANILMQRGDISIDMQGNALMELLRRCERGPLALGQIRRVAPGVLRPLFELGIETLDDIIMHGKDI